MLTRIHWLIFTHSTFSANNDVVSSDEHSSVDVTQMFPLLMMQHALDNSLVESDEEKDFPFMRPTPTLEDPPIDASDSSMFDDTSSENTPVVTDLFQRNLVEDVKSDASRDVSLPLFTIDHGTKKTLSKKFPVTT